MNPTIQIIELSILKIEFFKILYEEKKSLYNLKKLKISKLILEISDLIYLNHFLSYHSNLEEFKISEMINSTGNSIKITE